MTVAILSPVALRPGGTLIEGNIGSDKRIEHNTFRCGHCGNVIIMDPARAKSGDHRRCLTCGQLHCGRGGCAVSCNDFRRDMDLAFRDVGNQPWLLRHYGEPVDRLYAADGTELLVLRCDHNMTLAERTRYRRG